MKILLVNIDKGWGGGQEHLRVLAGELQRTGCAPHFLCREKTPSSENFASLGFPVWPLWGADISLLRSVKETAALLQREHYDIVMVTREHDLFRTLVAWKLAFPFKKQGKLVMCYHTAIRRKQLFLNAVDAVVCVSAFIRDTLLAGNSRVPAVTIINNGIPVMDPPPAERFSLRRPRRFFQEVPFPLVGMVGAFFKNQGELIEIIPLLREEFPTIKVALVGDNSDAGLTKPLMEKAERLGVAESVIITGKIPHERMADIYFDLDLSVSTFRNEGFGLVHLESLAAGTPVVAYNEGGQVDIFKGNEAGVLVDGGPEQFVAAVIGLLKSHDSRYAMGRQGYEIVKHKFSPAAMANSYLSFFSGLQREGCGNR